MRSVLRTFARLVCCVGLATFGLLSGCCPSPPTAEPAPDLAPPSDLGADPGPTCQAAMGLAADIRLLCGGTGEWGWFIKSIAVLGHK